jgi:uncharacterized protein YdhG (YjbR/CyaY superfamily)
MPTRSAPRTIDEYIARCPDEVQVILEKIRAIVAAVAPDAQERISYRMPAFWQQGILIYFAAFKSHIGIYPPFSGDAKLEGALARYRGPKGNLKFPLDEPIPYQLIRRLVKRKLEQNLAKVTKRR